MNELLLLPLVGIELFLIFERDIVYSVLLFLLFSIISSFILFYYGQMLPGFFILILFTTGVVVLLIISTSFMPNRLVKLDRKFLLFALLFSIPFIFLSVSSVQVEPQLLLFPIITAIGAIAALFKVWK